MLVSLSTSLYNGRMIFCAFTIVSSFVGEWAVGPHVLSISMAEYQGVHVFQFVSSCFGIRLGEMERWWLAFLDSIDNYEYNLSKTLDSAMWTMIRWMSGQIGSFSRFPKRKRRSAVRVSAGCSMWVSKMPSRADSVWNMKRLRSVLTTSNKHYVSPYDLVLHISASILSKLSSKHRRSIRAQEIVT